jgi:hypothetical protein
MVRTSAASSRYAFSGDTASRATSVTRVLEVDDLALVVGVWSTTRRGTD